MLGGSQAAAQPVACRELRAVPLTGLCSVSVGIPAPEIGAFHGGGGALKVKLCFFRKTSSNFFIEFQ
jgi:hypothetical protein